MIQFGSSLICLYAAHDIPVFLRKARLMESHRFNQTHFIYYIFQELDTYKVKFKPFNLIVNSYERFQK